MYCSPRVVDNGWKAPWNSKEQAGRLIEEDSLIGEEQKGGGLPASKHDEGGKAREPLIEFGLFARWGGWSLTQAGRAVESSSPAQAGTRAVCKRVWGTTWVCRCSGYSSHHGESASRIQDAAAAVRGG